jgi:TLD
MRHESHVSLRQKSLQLSRSVYRTMKSNKIQLQLRSVVLLLLTSAYNSEGFSLTESEHSAFGKCWSHYNGNKPNRCKQCCNEYKTGTATTKISMTVDPITILNELDTEGNAPLLAFAACIVALSLTIPPSRLIRTSDLHSIVKDTYLERQKNQLQCIYKASKDGWSAIQFHHAVDNMGSGIVVARTATGTTFGGYNPNGWRSTDDYYTSSSAFLWCYDIRRKIVKLPVLPGGNCAIFDYATSGPCFGAADLVIGPPQAAIMGGFTGPDAEDISKSAGSLRQCKSAIKISG